MARHSTRPNPYELLQVRPGASSAEITAAYERLVDMYRPERTATAAPEFQAQAAHKRAELEAAYHELSNGKEQHIANDQGSTASVVATEQSAALDYRPLPPARRQERSVVAQQLTERPPTRRPVQRSKAQRWFVSLGLMVTFLALLLGIVLNGVRTSGGAAAQPTPPILGLELPFTNAQIAQFRSAAEGSNTAQTWTALGNALFDNLQTMRENAPQSPQYRGQLQGWLEAAQAYERALSIEESATVRADRALALFNYGLDAPDTARVSEAVAEVERGVQGGTAESRALLNYGLIFVQLSPPRVDDALTQWRKVIEVAPGTPEAQRAEFLIQRYGRR